MRRRRRRKFAHLITLLPLCFSSRLTLALGPLWHKKVIIIPPPSSFLSHIYSGGGRGSLVSIIPDFYWAHPGWLHIYQAEPQPSLSPSFRRGKPIPNRADIYARSFISQRGGGEVVGSGGGEETVDNSRLLSPLTLFFREKSSKFFPK